MKFNKKYISGKFAFILVMAVIAILGIIFFMAKTMIFEKDKWEVLKKSEEGKDSIEIQPNRGNILSADGQLLASSLPDYKVYLDFMSALSRQATRDNNFSHQDSTFYNEKDSLFLGKSAYHKAVLDTICNGLAAICPNMTAEQYRQHLANGWNQHKRYYEVCPHQVLDYLQYKQMLTLPFFRDYQKRKNFVGLSVEERNNRKKPFGSLAKRLLGDMYGAKDSARSGIELAYDSLLKGLPGYSHRRKVRNQMLNIIDKEPVNGYDIVTTIDVTMQDICENALREELKQHDADMGVVVLMDVKTGDVKAMVNLSRYDDGNFYEARNFALAALMEPGSTFKTASILVGLDDGEINLNDQVDGCGGIYMMHGSAMKDHNWARGGYRMQSVAQTLMHSSNIGVSRLIDDHYHNKPEKFVEGLRRVGIGMDLKLPFVGSAVPVIRMPKPDRSNWSKTALAWMSIGYETQIPPISTVTFYNAIANNGKLMQPRFVTAIQKDGEVVRECPPVVLSEQIAKPQTIKDIRDILKRVVNDKEGVGKPAKSKYFLVSGKTGTAQVGGKGGYKGGGHLVSFCGYFPSDEPQYTCIVAIRICSGPASGGLHAGTVFKKIAETIYAKAVTSDLSRAADSLSVFVPHVKSGNISAANKVLAHLNIPTKGGNCENNEIGSSHSNGKAVEFSIHDSDFFKLPDLTGMGLRDAVYEIERRGMKARVEGVGKVNWQSVLPGTNVQKGMVVELTLE